MRFRFCGDVDCPDWVLAEIGTLSRLTSVKMKLLCSQVLKDLLGSAIDYEKVYKLTSDAKFESGDVKATIAALSFIVTSAAKYNVDAQSLSNELQQLGLPKEHTSALCKVYADNQIRLQEELQRQSLRLSRLDSVDWRVDYVLSSSLLQEINKPSVQLKLGIKKPESDRAEQVSFTLTDDMFRILLHELKQAHSKMESLGSG